MNRRSLAKMTADLVTGSPTPADLAATVERTPEHVALEKRLGELRRRRDRARARPDGGGFAEMFARHGLGDDAALSGAILDLRHQLAPHRARHGRAVAKALAPSIRVQAQRALAALGDVSDAFGQVNALREQIRRAAGPGDSLQVGPLIERLRLLALDLLRKD